MVSYRLQADAWAVCDNSGDRPKLLEKVREEEKPKTAQQRLRDPDWSGLAPGRPSGAQDCPRPWNAHLRLARWKSRG